MKPSNKQQGIALVIVLWMLALLTILATGYSRMMRTETMLTANMVHSSQATSLAEAGINIAIVELLKPVLEQDWKTDGTPYEYELNNNIITVKIRAENGKIDLNTAPTELLYGLLKSVNETEEDLLPLLQAMLDWRDKNDQVRNHGAEDEYYRYAGLRYGAKDGPFNSLDELLLVKGFTPELYRKIKPALTIYSHQAEINLQSAPREVLLAVPYISTTEVDSYLEQREASNVSDRSVSLPGVDSKYIARGKGTVFSITSEAKINNTLARLNVVVSLRRNEQQPYIILAWQISPEMMKSKPGGMETEETEKS
jgi:general secretion pathway protein K